LKSKCDINNDRQISLVLGVNGQDGSYLAESLLAKGRSVVGVGRQEVSRYVQNSELFSYRQLDLTDIKGLALLLDELSPHKIFHVAAIHGSFGFNYEGKWQEAHCVNTLSLHAILEYFRCADIVGNLIYLSSSKAFGLPLPALISETAERQSSCIYSITKNAATDLVRYYRNTHGISASVLWTFNHESIRRGSEYFIPKVVDCLASAIEVPEYSTEFFTLNFYADWSDAGELMDIAISASDRRLHEDFIFASGETVFARDLVKSLFLAFGLDYRNHVTEKTSGEFAEAHWKADISKMSRMLERTPKIPIYDTCLKILESKYGYDCKDKLLLSD
tara:strand:- start:4349 stop:5347 length:999 start_codon:yes stop_codon:yes gene_type:complete